MNYAMEQSTQITPEELIKEYPKTVKDIQAIAFVSLSFRMEVGEVEFEFLDEQPRVKRFSLTGKKS
jgi:hypothetical protein